VRGFESKINQDAVTRPVSDARWHLVQGALNSFAFWAKPANHRIIIDCTAPKRWGDTARHIDRIQSQDARVRKIQISSIRQLLYAYNFILGSRDVTLNSRFFRNRRYLPPLGRMLRFKLFAGRQNRPWRPLWGIVDVTGP
jgi:hypothetical protein